MTYRLVMIDGKVHVQRSYQWDHDLNVPIYLEPEPMDSRYVDVDGNTSGEETVSEFFAENHIVGVKKLDDGTFEVTEHCDQYFAVCVDRDVLQQWINELQKLVDES